MGYVKEELYFALDSSSENLDDAYLCFQFLFIQCFISFPVSISIFLCTVFGDVSSNMRKVP